MNNEANFLLFKQLKGNTELEQVILRIFLTLQKFIIDTIKIVTLNVDPKVTDITLNSMIFVINIFITNLARKYQMTLSQTFINHVYLWT